MAKDVLEVALNLRNSVMVGVELKHQAREVKKAAAHGSILKGGSFNLPCHLKFNDYE